MAQVQRTPTRGLFRTLKNTRKYPLIVKYFLWGLIKNQLNWISIDIFSEFVGVKLSNWAVLPQRIQKTHLPISNWADFLQGLIKYTPILKFIVIFKIFLWGLKWTPRKTVRWQQRHCMRYTPFYSLTS